MKQIKNICIDMHCCLRACADDARDLAYVTQSSVAYVTQSSVLRGVGVVIDINIRLCRLCERSTLGQSV